MVPGRAGPFPQPYLPLAWLGLHHHFLNRDCGRAAGCGTAGLGCGCGGAAAGSGFFCGGTAPGTAPGPE